MTTAAVGQRGRTRITDRVATRIAIQSAAELPAVLRVDTGGPMWAQATEAKVAGEAIAIRLAVTVAYPVPLRELSAQIRDYVAHRVAQLTGLAVSRVDLRITTELQP
ncbi:Asp23/Gls24 family envelope stress response protein [Nonomuraea sediminis]|uniref:Asp23/Gls24 family envelope stress response protein n=1 Tax=Nonomuraea sediminis TaxID=2835864 RepID=UPI001BDBC36E|nr:Asp23/Gls24 family envelope stress response protein [Nonomuraea sediminis]